MSQPLAGLRVLVTRARTHASNLSERLEAFGAIPVVLPSIEFEFLEGAERDALDDAIRCVADFDTVILTSVRGVEALKNRLEVLGMGTTEILSSRRLIAVGNVTSAALANAVRAPDLVPTEFSAAGILDALGNVKGQRFLLLRAEQASEDLPTGLRDRGAIVDDIVAYRIVKSTELGSDVLAGPRPDIITFTSSSGVHNTHQRLVSAKLDRWLEESPIACIGPVTASAVLELGYEVAMTARESTIEGLVAALIQFRSGKEMSLA